jgi:hypothetical protein
LLRASYVYSVTEGVKRLGAVASAPPVREEPETETVKDGENVPG